MLGSVSEFITAHPWFSLLILIGIYNLAEWPFRLVNRAIRHRNIASAGWPPSHLDGDGDVVDKSV